MAKQKAWFWLGLGVLITNSTIPIALAYDASVYDNLQRSRDALLDQRQHLQDQYEAVARLIDQYQQKLGILDGYIKQNDQALQDIDSALNRDR